MILIAVDVTVRPLITVLIFNRNKKSLRFDLTVVGCCQLAFLAYGLHAIHTGRPAIIAYNVDRGSYHSAICGRSEPPKTDWNSKSPR